MILEWLWAKIAGFLGWLLSLFPTFTVPDWVNTIGSYATQGITWVNGLHNWVPLEAMRVSLGFLLGCGAVVLAVRGFRIVLSLFTGGGGGAA